MRKLHFLWNHTFSQFLHLTFARCLVETKHFVPPTIDDLLLKCWQWRIFHTVVSWLTGSKDENFHNDGQNHIKNITPWFILTCICREKIVYHEVEFIFSVGRLGDFNRRILRYKNKTFQNKNNFFDENSLQKFNCQIWRKRKFLWI